MTKRNGQGMALSSSSQPTIMAAMLELLDVQPGDRVLEIGAGTATTQRCWCTSPAPQGG